MLTRIQQVFGMLLAGAALFAPAALQAREEMDDWVSRPHDQVDWRLRLGPFFERRVMKDGSTFTAVRPFYSKLSNAVSRDRYYDSLWPLATFHNEHGDKVWWRVLNCYGNEENWQQGTPWMFTFFPLYSQGRTRGGEDYWAFFPFYGYLPDAILLEDFHFAMFPCYLDYKVNGVGRYYVLWPFYSQTQETKLTNEWHSSYFPFYGKSVHRDSTNHFAFWPFWVSATYTAESRDPGSSWSAFPFAAAVNRQKESTWWAIPPLVSYGTNQTASRLRAPWPIVEYTTQDRGKRRKLNIWPLYSQQRNEDDDYRYTGGWFIFSLEHTHTQARRYERARFFPVYVNESTYSIDKKSGKQVELEHYLRIWPFFSLLETPERSHFRALELNPLRYAGGFERNWGPFWTLYERHSRPEAVEHDILWGIIDFEVGRDRPNGAPKEQP